VVFFPFAAGYYLSYFYRYVNTVIAKDLVQDFGLPPGDLGLLTSVYFLAFAAFQLPLGVLLDRCGPGRCASAPRPGCAMAFLLDGGSRNVRNGVIVKPHVGSVLLNIRCHRIFSTCGSRATPKPACGARPAPARSWC